MARSRRPRLPRRTEASIEDACVRYATERGWLARKMNGLGHRDWPDRLFVPPRRRDGVDLRRPFWVEFKRPGKDLTIAQATMRAELIARGEVVFGPVRSFIEFKSIFGMQHG